ncbi:hypothetical protein TIFTF001_036274 [Ficus carica]|uniref:Uncharacterized protein n=1 Tax=Ficus carica TaxID=3494 RepID=A0AA88E313_FICCA|nr:hypothetical protein TIFTF001_036274 [Ficus carica]
MTYGDSKVIFAFRLRGIFGKGEGVVEVAAELVVVGGKEEEEEGVVGACGAVSGSLMASFRVVAEPEVEAADLGILFLWEGTRKMQKKKKQRKEGKGRAQVRGRGRKSAQVSSSSFIQNFDFK